MDPPDANGVSKWAGEQYWLLEHRVRGRPVVSLRLTNCYGPRLRIRDARQTFLGIWIRRVLEGRAASRSGAATQLRDLTYVDDVTRGLPAGRRARRRSRQAASSTSADRRRPRCTTLAEPADRRQWRAAARYVTREFPADRAAIDIGSYHADDRAFRAAAGWAPKVGLDEGMSRSLEWFRPRLADYL